MGVGQTGGRAKKRSWEGGSVEGQKSGGRGGLKNGERAYIHLNTGSCLASESTVVVFSSCIFKHTLQKRSEAAHFQKSQLRFSFAPFMTVSFEQNVLATSSFYFCQSSATKPIMLHNMYFFYFFIF